MLCLGIPRTVHLTLSCLTLSPKSRRKQHCLPSGHVLLRNVFVCQKGDVPAFIEPTPSQATVALWAYRYISITNHNCSNTLIGLPLMGVSSQYLLNMTSCFHLKVSSPQVIAAKPTIQPVHCSTPGASPNITSLIYTSVNFIKVY